jgi:hypothetical protein
MQEVVTTDNLADVIPVDVVENELESTVDLKTLFVPQRLENESFSDYKDRRLVAKYKVHQMAQGNLIWNSKEQGTYRKVK